MFYNCMDLGPVVLNYGIINYIVKSSTNSNLLMVEPSATVKMDKWCTYIVLMLCMHFHISYHMVAIFITSIYMVLMMSPCVLVCGVVMRIRI